MVFSIIAAVIAVVASAGVYYQQKRMEAQAKKQAQEAKAVQVSGHDSNRGLYTVYGTALVGSTVVWKTVTPKEARMTQSGFTTLSRATTSQLENNKDHGPNRFLYRAVTLCNGPITSVTNVTVDDEGYMSPRFGGHSLHFATTYSKGPAAGQNFSALRTAYPTAFESWGSTAVGNGVAYAVERLFLDPDNSAYQGEPQTRYRVQGRALYDPRKDSTSSAYDSSLGTSTHRAATATTWEYSSNPVLALLDYLLNEEYGRGLDISTIDIDSIASSADKCDVLVDIPARLTNQTGSDETQYDPQTGITYVTTPLGDIAIYRPDQVSTGSEANKQKRFSINVALDPSKEVLDNIQEILNVFRGNLSYANGKYFVHMADVASPVLTLGDDDIIGGLKVANGDRSQRMNRATIKFINDNKQSKTDQVSWPSLDSNEDGGRYATYLAEDEDEKLHRTFTIKGCTDYYQAQDTAEYLVRDSRSNLTVSGTFSSRCFGLVPGDVIALTYDSSGFSGKYFRVIQTSVDLLKMTVQLQLKEYDSSVYTWNASRANEPIGLSWHEEVVNAVPTSLTIGTIVTNTRTQADGSSALTLTVPFTNVPESAQYVEVSWAINGTTEYNTQLVFDTENQTQVEIAIDRDNQTYAVRLRYFITNSYGTLMPSAYSTTTHTVSSLTGTKLAGIETGATANTGALADLNTVDTAQIDDQAITIAKIDTSLQSTNYNAGTAGWKLTKAGVFEAGNGTFRGAVTATSGNIGGFSIQTDYIKDAADSMGLASTVTGGDDVRFWAGNTFANRASAPFRVTEAGVVTASSGAIGGFTLSGTSLIAGSGVTRVSLSTADGISLGNNTFASAPFRVDRAGALTATNATITGAVTATSGTFTGTVNANAGAFTGDVSTDSKFIAGTGDATTVIDGEASATYRIFSGAAQTESENAPFQVKPDGSVFAKNITVFDSSGNILLDQDGLGAAALAGISLTSGTAVDKVSGVLSGDGGEMTLTLDQTATVTLETKFAIYDNSVGTLYLRGTGATSSAALSDITNATLKITYSLKTDSNGYQDVATKDIAFTNSSTPSSTEVYVTAIEVSGSFLTVLMDAGGALEYIANTSTYGATAYVVSSHTFTNLAAGVHKVKLSSTITGSGSPDAAGQSTSNRLYELTSSAINFVESAANVFANGTPSVPSGGGTVSGNLVVTGDLTVNGTTTTVNTDNLTVKDNNITLNYSSGDSSSTANNAGITVQDAVNSTTDATLLWKTATDTFEFSHPIKAKSDLTLSSSGGDAGIYWKDSSASDATAWHLHADVTQATSNMYLNYAGGGTNFAFVSNGNFLAPGTIFADGAASNSLQWEAGYDYSQIGHLPLAGGNLTGNVRFGNTSVGTEDDSEYLLSTGGQLIIRANDSADDASYTNLILDSGKAGGTETNSAGVVTRTNNVNRMRVDGLGGISFFEDTGTTAKMVWSPTSEELQFADNVKATFGAGPEIEIYSNGAVGYIDTAQLIIANAAHTNNIAKFIQGGAVELYYSNNLRLSTSATGIQVTGNIANASGDMTVDSAGGLILDAATGVISLHEAGNGVFGTLTRASGSLAIKSEVSDADILFKGSDSGSQITALTLDMSNGGAATFNSSVTSTGLISGSLLNPANNSLTILGGGSATNNGANLTMYGGSASASAGDFRFRNGTTETARITAAGAATFNSSVQTGGLVDVRTSHTSTDVTAANSNTTLRLLNSGSGNGIYNAIKFSGNQQDMYIMSFNNATQADRRLGFFVGSTAGDAATDERLSITGDGNVSIGNTAAATRLHVKSSGGVGTSSTFETDAPSSAINFVNTGSSTNAYLGSVGTSLFFATNNAERARFTSDGALLLGTTSTSIATTSSETGTQITDGGISIAANNPVAQFNRISSDGAIVNLRKNGSTIGSLGNDGTDLTINSQGGMLKLFLAGSRNYNFDTSRFYPQTDNARDLGASSVRFKNLYLSGGVYANNASGAFLWNASNAHIAFGTNNSERARLTSDGNFLVGKTSAGFANTGHELRGGGSYAAFTRDGGTPVLVNRKSSDGALVEYMKDGTTIGSLGVSAFNGLQLGSASGTGFRFDTNDIMPMKSGSASDAVVNLGYPTVRFKELYLSSNLKVGGSSSFQFQKSGTHGYINQSDSGDLIFRMGSGFSERARLKSDGKFGLGIASPSANIHIYSSGQAIARVEGANEYYSGLMIRNNHSSTQSQWHVAAAGGTSGWGAVNGNFIIRDDTTNSTGIEIERGAGGATGALYIDASGNVGISVTPSAFVLPDGSSGALQLQSGGMVSAYNGVTHLSQNWYYNSGEKYIANGSASRLVMSGADYIWQSAGNNTSGAGAALTWSESMRLSGGNLLVATTDSSPHNNTSGNGVALSAGGVDVAVADGETLYLNRMGSNGRTVNFRRAGTFVAGIDVTTTAVAYNTSSDQRLKSNIEDADDAGSKVDAIQVRKFDWKADGQHQDYGMIAQELIEVAPEAVSAPQDPDEMMGVDYSKLVPMLIKEIQQLRKRVKDLEEE